MTKKISKVRAKTQDEIRLEDFLPYRFYLITASLSGLLLEKLRPHGVTVQRWRVLMVVANHGPKSIGQLVDLTFIPQSGLSRVVDQMERDLLVTRSTSEEDSRRVTVHLTAQGQAIYQKLLPLVREYEEALTSGFDQAEQRTLVSYLKRVMDNLKAHSSPETSLLDSEESTAERVTKPRTVRLTSSSRPASRRPLRGTKR